MIIPDTNLLIYAVNDRAVQHRAAKEWWEHCLNGSTPIGLSSVAVNGFIRLMTHPRVLVQPMTVGSAITQIRSWLACPPVQIVHPGEKFTELYFNLLKQLGTAANLTTDAHLAALAIEYQAELHSNDVDFSRFPGLRWRNPISP